MLWSVLQAKPRALSPPGPRLRPGAGAGPGGGPGGPRGYLRPGNERRCRDLLAAATARARDRRAAGTPGTPGAAAAAAAVLVPLCTVRGAPALLYTLRSALLAGRHRGDVSFPGGKCDPVDRDVVATALRETHEELGLQVQERSVWGVLEAVPDSKNSHIVPVVAQVGALESLCLTPNPQEVDDVFTLPLAHLLQDGNQGYTHFCVGGRYRYTLPVFLHGPYRVWGLTAIITERTLELLVPGAYRRRTHGPGL
ncbi:nucleoside diphosphate-linked moiety X motif 8 isoform X2 [Ornithorhynchus anatinus]|uniref:nucleoside diphosphate-linked moiety X motif 8 isoform X2 n=1 Tax=Ornithorhynchus anatinus TaxID=9258 RepID=UPI0010A7B70A|nr:nucleoside diphosphate-linked moiety X motif 8 isoform X2 [Ornithorhynchus anatinus]